MNPSSLLLAAILATLYGAGFHLWQGGSWRRLVLYLSAGWVGFAIGQGIGLLLNLRILMAGPLYIVPATLGSLVALLSARWLALAERPASRSAKPPRAPGGER